MAKVDQEVEARRRRGNEGSEGGEHRKGGAKVGRSGEAELLVPFP